MKLMQEFTVIDCIAEAQVLELHFKEPVKVVGISRAIAQRLFEQFLNPGEGIQIIAVKKHTI